MKKDTRLEASIGGIQRSIERSECIDGLTEKEAIEKHSDLDYIGVSNRVEVEGIDMANGRAFYCFAKRVKRKMVEPENDFPRRNITSLHTPAEAAIRNAVMELEKVGAHPNLTAVLCYLNKGQEILADYLEENNLV